MIRRTLRPLVRRRLLGPMLAAFGLALAPALACAAQVDAAVIAAPVVPGARRVMVMLQLGAEHYRAGGDYGGAYGDAMGEQARLRLARKIAREHKLSVVENWPMQLVGVDCIVMEVSDDRTPEAVAAELTGLPGVERWSGESAQGDKWIFCLTAAIVPHDRRSDEQTTTPEPQSGFQGEGGIGCREG